MDAETFHCPTAGCASESFHVFCSNPLEVLIDSSGQVYDEALSGYEWDDESKMWCVECGFSGTVSQFTARPETVNAPPH